MWFVFHDGEHIIRAWGSSFSGLERVYVDDEVVSEQRNLKRSSGHAFAIDSDRYVVRFVVVNLLKGQLNCRLLKNGDLLKSIVSGYVGTMFSFSGFLLSVVAAGLVAGSAAFLQLPPWLAVPCIFVVAFAVTFVFRAKPKIVLRACRSRSPALAGHGEKKHGGPAETTGVRGNVCDWSSTPPIARPGQHP